MKPIYRMRFLSLNSFVSTLHRVSQDDIISANRSSHKRGHRIKNVIISFDMTIICPDARLIHPLHVKFILSEILTMSPKHLPKSIHLKSN